MDGRKGEFGCLVLECHLREVLGSEKGRKKMNSALDLSDVEHLGTAQQGWTNVLAEKLKTERDIT